MTEETRDKIEELVVESVRLGEEVWQRAIALKETSKKSGKPITEDQIMELEAMEDESERLWEEAKKLGKPGVTHQNYEDLANAIIVRGMRDWEGLISGSVTPGAPCNETEIRNFMKHQVYTRLDTEEMLDTIQSVYTKKFIPYAKKHKNEIIEQWEKFKSKKMVKEECEAASQHICPLCGGCFRPRLLGDTVVIGCTNCSLSY